MVVVVVSVAVAWHMGEYVATSSSAIVVVVKRGAMALILMGSVKRDSLALASQVDASVRDAVGCAVFCMAWRCGCTTGDGRTEDSLDWLTWGACQKSEATELAQLQNNAITIQKKESCFARQ